MLPIEPNADNKDFTIGKLSQQNSDLKNLVKTLKTKIDELVIRKEMSCFMCREELRSCQRNCQDDLETAKNDYLEKLEDLGEQLTKINEQNSKSAKGKFFIICERDEYENLHDRLRISSDDCSKLRKELEDQKFVNSVVGKKDAKERKKSGTVIVTDSPVDKNSEKKVQSLKRKNFRLKEELDAINSHVGNMEELITVMKEQRRHYIGLLQQANKI